MKSINIFLADGFEDIEALAVNDVLRRAGLEVNLVSVTGDLLVRSSHKVLVAADKLLDDCDFSVKDLCRNDFMIFPGGMPGSKSLAANGKLIEAMKAHYAAGGYVGAICAAPGLVLSQLDSLDGQTMTCFDGFEDALIAKGVNHVRKSSVVSGRIVSGRSAGYAFDFGLNILKVIAGEDIAEKVRSGILLDVK